MAVKMIYIRKWLVPLVCVSDMNFLYLSLIIKFSEVYLLIFVKIFI